MKNNNVDFINAELKRIKKNNLYRQLRHVKIQGSKIIIKRKEIINLSSNDYLGIPTSKLSIKQLQSSSRLISGNDESYKLARNQTCQT